MAPLSAIPFLLVLLSSCHVHGQGWTGRDVLSSLQSLGLHETSLDVMAVEDIITQVGKAALREPSAADAQPWSLYLPVFADPESPCGVAVAAMASSLEGKASLGVLQMVDSWTKLRDGYLYGLPFILGFGSYSECVHAESPELGIKGKYCTVMSLLNPFYNGTQAEMDNMLRLVQTSANMNLDTFMQYSTCIPDACTEDDMEKSLFIALEEMKMAAVICHALDEPDYEFTAGDIAMTSFLSMMLALMTAGSIADLFCRMTSAAPSTGVRFLLPFSAYTNLEKMFHVTTESRPGVISCLHGMRVLSMTWVIYGHQYIFDAFYSANLLHLGKWTNGLLFQVIFNATVSTDSFFFLSGLLVSYGVLKEVKRTGKLNIIMYYVHRLIRLTPPIALVTLFLATLFKFLPTGPLYYAVESLVTTCSKYWWMDVLYVNNFLTINETTNQSSDCLAQCWYTAVDTQLYLVAPLVLLPLALYPSRGKILLYVVTLVSFIVPAAVIYTNDLPPASMIGGTENVDNMAYQILVYFTPWCRMSAYIVGFWAGFIIHDQGSEKLHLTPLQVLTGWTVAAFSALSVLLGMWSYNTLGTTSYYDPVTQILYGGLHRGVWCAALAWVVLACHFGYGGVVNDFLSHPTWQPLSRLTYSMYLVAIPVQFYFVASLKEFPYFTHINKIFQTCGAIFVSIIAAVLVSLTAESPVLGLEKLIFKRPGRGEDNPKATAPTSVKRGHENLAFSKEHEEKQMAEVETQLNVDMESSLHQNHEAKETTQL
ncbi:nose resistant to fluoxetine protein 6-like isoform X2 [Penaeus japonicus]|uniref:nose resistant to fluoxetine protein 6-like isoform X2 n=1 Tax=Penaeus japonicus TaxID=27405 RepID=UPI001C710E51|nr:nose resistant to fluoxetine protein 6-like isoform X2 [Penaeus japonicus]